MGAVQFCLLLSSSLPVFTGPRDTQCLYLSLSLPQLSIISTVSIICHELLRAVSWNRLIKGVRKERDRKKLADSSCIHARKCFKILEQQKESAVMGDHAPRRVEGEGERINVS